MKRKLIWIGLVLSVFLSVFGSGIFVFDNYFTQGENSETLEESEAFKWEIDQQWTGLYMTILHHDEISSDFVEVNDGGLIRFKVTNTSDGILLAQSNSFDESKVENTFVFDEKGALQYESQDYIRPITISSMQNNPLKSKTISLYVDFDNMSFNNMNSLFNLTNRLSSLRYLMLFWISSFLLGMVYLFFTDRYENERLLNLEVLLIVTTVGSVVSIILLEIMAKTEINKAADSIFNILSSTTFILGCIGAGLVSGYFAWFIKQYIDAIRYKTLTKQSKLLLLFSEVVNKTSNGAKNIIKDTNSTKLNILITIGLGLLFLANAIGVSSGQGFIVVAITDLVILYFILKCNKQWLDIRNYIKNIREGNYNQSLNQQKFFPIFTKLVDDVNNINEGIDQAVEERIKNERMNLDLIANISHDLKTPVTSILNYLELYENELDIDKKAYYLSVIKDKALVLSKLSNDVVDASRASSGKVNAKLVPLEVLELLNQILVDYESSFKNKGLVVLLSEDSLSQVILADPNLLVRVFTNILDNIKKYALDNTRVYIDMNDSILSFSNVSNHQLGPLDLTARFVQGEVSRHEEGSGLGLSIAKDLMKVMQGDLIVKTQADLFCVECIFKKSEN